MPHKEQLLYFGGDDGDELSLQFDFIGMQNLYLSLARHDARPLVKALTERPAPSSDVQWATFVRNHDELTLDKLTDEERAEVFAAFGPEERMQIFGRGLIRRLPPMLGGDPRRIRMVYSLLFSLPGTPFSSTGRRSGWARISMRATGSPSAPDAMDVWSQCGFSTARPSRLVAPVVEGPSAPSL